MDDDTQKRHDKAPEKPDALLRLFPAIKPAQGDFDGETKFFCRGMNVPGVLDGKRGRGTEKAAVMVSVSLTEDGKPKYAKMEVVDAVDGETAKSFAGKHAAKGSEIRTDGLNVYAQLPQNGYTLTQKAFNAKTQPEQPHWTHIIISNAKAFIGGTLHGLDKIHLQRCLDEFCYRFNRRRLASSVFPKLVNACVGCGRVVAYELIG